jgi:2-methylcitrate dehydratase PrpD
LSNDADPARCLEQTDTAFVKTITFKAHAACAVTHPAIDAVADLMRINHFIASDISAVFIRIAPEADSICNIAAPNSGLELKFSIRAVVAMTLLGIDTASPASYSDLLASDAVLKTLIARTNVTLSPDFDLGSTALAIHLEDGRVLERVGGFDFVSDTEQLTQMLIDKFLSLAMPFIGEAAAQQCLAQIMGETQGLSARQLLALAAPA